MMKNIHNKPFTSVFVLWAITGAGLRMLKFQAAGLLSGKTPIS
jgi:hypothetical protein